MSTNSELLPRFQEFLIGQEGISRKYAPFFAYWVNSFTYYVNKRESVDLKEDINSFLEELKQDKEIENWQIEQAKTALEVYVDKYLLDEERIKSSLNKDSEIKYSKVIQKLRNVIRLKSYSYSTERTYTDWIRRFFEFIFEKGGVNEAKDIKEEDVVDFLSYLAIEKKVSSSTQNQAYNAILFLFRDVLDKEIKSLKKTVRLKRGPKLPVVLSIEEIKLLFEQVREKDLIILQLLYGCGLRLSELVRLRVLDIDFESSLIFVRGGEGQKCRTTILPMLVKKDLRKHLKKVEMTHVEDIEKGCGNVYLSESLSIKYPNSAKQWKWQYVFPSNKLSVDSRTGKVRRHHISDKAIQNIISNVVKRAKILKHATVHTLRHSFATHLLMDGINIRQIQKLLGHKSVETTMIYTHVVKNISKEIVSPLDRLKLKGATKI